MSFEEEGDEKTRWKGGKGAWMVNRLVRGQGKEGRPIIKGGWEGRTGGTGGDEAARSREVAS